MRGLALITLLETPYRSLYERIVPSLNYQIRSKVPYNSTPTIIDLPECSFMLTSTTETEHVQPTCGYLEPKERRVQEIVPEIHRRCVFSLTFEPRSKISTDLALQGDKYQKVDVSRWKRKAPIYIKGEITMEEEYVATVHFWRLGLEYNLFRMLGPNQPLYVATN